MERSPSYEVMRILTHVRRLERAIVQQADDERQKELLDELALWLTALEFEHRRELGFDIASSWVPLIGLHGKGDELGMDSW